MEKKASSINASKSPKNKKQIGKVGRGDKIYIEDYAVTYLNQIARRGGLESGIAGLFGTCREVEEKKEYYIYAAACIEDVKLTEKGVPREAVQKIMKTRAEHFGDMFFLGWAILLKGTAGTLWEKCYRGHLETLLGKPEVLLTLQADTCEEHFYLYPTEMPKEAEGYFIFYDKNDAMQNYLIEWHGANLHAGAEKPVDYATETYRMYFEERKKEKTQRKASNWLFAFAILAMVGATAIGIGSLNGYYKMQEAAAAMNTIALENEEEQMHFETTEVPAESVLKEELLQGEKTDETENIASEYEPTVSEQNVAGNMQTEREESIKEDNPAVEPSDLMHVNVETVTTEAVIYEVVKGDTLIGICRKFYGNSNSLEEICLLNGIENPNTILCGQKIVLP